MSNELIYALTFSILFFLTGLLYAVEQKNGGAILISASIILAAIIICIKLEGVNKNK